MDDYRWTLFIGQLDGYTIGESVNLIERLFDESERKITKEIVCPNPYCYCYKIPIYKDIVEFYPITQMFIESVLPNLKDIEEIPEKLMETLRVLAVRSELGVRTSYLVRMPKQFGKELSIYICKIILTSLGGYFAELASLPFSGILNKTDHFYSEQLDWQDLDVLGNIEDIIDAYK